MANPRQATDSAPDSVARIASWLVTQGIEGAEQEQLLEGYCEQLVAAGIPLQRLHVAQRALHPNYGSLGFDWFRSSGVAREHYQRTPTPEENWVRSPFYFMLKEGVRELRERLPKSRARLPYPILEDLRSNGATDYFAVTVPFGRPQSGGLDPNSNAIEGIAISWTSDAEGGFSEDHIDLLRGLMPTLCLSLKSASHHQMAKDLMAAYLGPDAGARVLSGEIQRGSLEAIHAVICYFDLQGFTRLSETNPGPTIIAMLNDYFGAVVAEIEREGGNVLKFMGDGLLAIFSSEDQAAACRSAVKLAAAIRETAATVNRRREAEGLPRTGFTLALHGGDVMYGNIGGENRLDFTVIGPTVNATARIQGLCGQLEQDLIISSVVVSRIAGERDDFISLGRYLLRGIPEPQELFTLLPPK